MPRESNLEVKVGAFVLVAIIALVVFIFSISDFSSLFQKGTTLKAVFQYANGLKKGAPVRVAGVDSGHVQELKVYYDSVGKKTMVEVQAWLMPGVGIPADSNLLINQLGILGEKYLEIIPGISKDMVRSDMILRGEDPVPLEDVMKKMSGLAEKMDGTLAAVNGGILTEANKKSLAETLANISAITAAIKNGEGTIGKLLLDKSVYENFALTLANIAVVTGSIKNGEGTIGMLLKDKSVYQNLDEMTADLKANPWKLFYRPKGSK